MQLGLGLPNLSLVDPSETLFRLSEAAATLAFDSIWVSDHVFIPYEFGPNYPYSATGHLGLQATDHILDPLTTLAFLAGRVDGPRLGISVLIIPYRNPIVTAKMLVTLDVLSGGRVILGAGVGWMPEEFAALQASYADRGAVTDDYLQVFKALCTEEKPSFEGRHYQLSISASIPSPSKNRTRRSGSAVTPMRRCGGPCAWATDGSRATWSLRRCWRRRPTSIACARRRVAIRRAWRFRPGSTMWRLATVATRLDARRR